MTEEKTKLLLIQNLNTLSCKIEDQKMKCTIHSLDEHEGKEIDDVYSVEGDIAVLAGGDRWIWIKTSPIIGLDASMIVEERRWIPKGKSITITKRFRE